MIRKTFFYIAFMMMLSSLLMVVANNLYIIGSFRWLWAPLFLLFTFIFYFNEYKNKNVLWALLYGVLFAGFLQYTLWSFANDWYKKQSLEDFYAMIVIVLFFTILYKRQYIMEWCKLAKLGLFFIFVTGVMTIIATEIEPLVVRASYSSAKYTMDNFYKLHKLGFGSYGYMTAVISFFPILIYFYKAKMKIWLSKGMLLFLIVFFFFVLLRAQIFANILCAALVSFLAWFGAANFKRNIFIVGFAVFILLLVPNRIWVNSFFNISGYFDQNSLLNSKFQDIAIFMENPEILETASSGTSGRVARYPMLWRAFKASPFLGDASYKSRYGYQLVAGGHLYWMSHLALWGIFGFILYIFVLKNVFKPVISMFDPSFKFYYSLSLFSVIIMGLMKNLGGREPYIVLLIIIPGLYLTQAVLQDTT